MVDSNNFLELEERYTFHDESIVLNEESQAANTCMKRWFGKMHKGGVRGSMLILVAAAMGPGCLALPNCFKQSGVILGSFFMIVSAFMSLAALYSLFLAAGKSKTSSYAQCGTTELGYKHGVIIQVILIIYTFGGTVVRQVLIGRMVAKFFEQAGMEGKFADINNRLYFGIVQVVVAVLLYPLCVKRDLSSLRYISTGGVIAILFIIITLMSQTANYKKEYWDADNTLKYWIIDLYTPSAFTLCVFVFTNYFVVFQVRGELTQPSQKRVNKVIVRAVLLEFFIYMSLIFPGYYSLLDKMPEVIINRPKLDGHYPGDIAIQIARIIMCCIIFFGIPLVINPQRQGIIILHKGLLKPYINIPGESHDEKNYRLSQIRLDKKNNPLTSVSNAYNAGLVAILLILSVALCVAYNKIVICIGILGGYFGCTIAILYPAVLYIKRERETNGAKWTIKLISIAIVSTIFCLLGYLSATLNTLRVIGVIS